MAVNNTNQSGGASPHEATIQRMTRGMPSDCEQFDAFRDQEIEKMFREINRQAALPGVIIPPTHVNGLGIVMMANVAANSLTVGRIPDRLYSFSGLWNRGGASGQSEASAVALPLDQYIGGEYVGFGIMAPCFGKVTVVQASSVLGSNHTAGTIGLIALENVTQAVTNDLENELSYLPSTPDMVLMDSEAKAPLEVFVGDIVRPEITFAFTPPKVVEYDASITLIFEEHSAYLVSGGMQPDASGVYVRNGEFNGYPLYVRIDRLYVMYMSADAGGGYPLAAPYRIAALGAEPTDYFEADTNSIIADTYTPNGEYLGIPTVTVQED